MTGLRDFLDRFFAAGPVSFERFMQEALYHPEFGYYSAHIGGIGARGDFATTVTLAPILGTAVARWIESEAARFSGGRPLHLVEAGPGDGSLMRQVLAALPWRLRRRLHLHLVEISPLLAAAQQKTLGRFRRRITWHPGLPETFAHIDRTAPGPVLLFSNEFVDAFPVRIFRGGGAQSPGPTAPPPDELHLTYRDDALSEAWLPAAGLPASTVFGKTFPAAQRLEVHHSYLRSLQEWAPRLGTGAILTVDYGATVDRLYDRRPAGTLRAYHRHQRFDGPGIYARFGQQDLTADVNFSDLVAWGQDLGLETVALTTQREFLAAHARPKGRAEGYLADPDGPGHAFLVLQQRKG